MPSFSVCVDASLVVRLVTEPRHSRLRSLWQRWSDHQLEPVAPTLIYFEVANAVYRLEKHGLIRAESATAALEAALALPMTLVSDHALHHQAIRLASRFALSACYDAHYLALADRLGVEFWTCDAKLAKAVARRLSWVHLVAAGA
jgi:predicted nucleic acid-binding protein